MDDTATRGRSDVDFEKFRLRNFVNKLVDLGEVEIHDEPVPLSDLSQIIEATPKAVLFRKAGPEQLEIVGNVAGSRARIAAALGMEPTADLAAEFQRRIASPQPTIEVSSDEAPVHEVIYEGDEADLTKLPFHPQHRYDGGAYISSALDYSINPETGLTNVGCRRLSLRNKRAAGTNVTAPSDLRETYLKCIQRGEKLPLNFTIGSHPLDFMAAGMRVKADEVKLVGTLRGEPVPLVKAITNDIMMPADVEMTIEGYLDEKGYIENEGPYGEMMGYYGPMHLDPIYHVTAITMRKDPLHQTVLHGCGDHLERAESVNISSIIREAQVRELLTGIGIEVVAVRGMLSSGECQHVRVAIRQKLPGQARVAISLLLGSLTWIKHVFITDDDIDLFDQDRFEWAFATRFQADKDIITLTGVRGLRMDPSMEGKGVGTKAGFDLTFPVDRRNLFLNRRSVPHTFTDVAPRFQTVEQALQEGPKFFTELMDGIGTRDGREVSVAIDNLRDQNRVERLSDGRFSLTDGGDS